MNKYVIFGTNERNNQPIQEVIEYSNDLIALIDSYMFAMIRNCHENYTLFRVNKDGSLTEIERI